VTRAHIITGYFRITVSVISAKLVFFQDTDQRTLKSNTLYVVSCDQAIPTLSFTPTHKSSRIKTNVTINVEDQLGAFSPLINLSE